MLKIWKWYRSKSFMLKLTSGFVLGLACGLLFGPANTFLAPLGQIFMNLLKMVVIPIIFLSLVVAVNHSEPKELGRIGAKVFPIYLITTGVAVGIGIIIAKFMRPGEGLSIPLDAAVTVPERPSFMNTIIDMIPANILSSFANGNILAVVFVAVIVGLAILFMRHSSDASHRDMGSVLMKFTEAANEVILRILNGVLEYAPIGVFGITAATIGVQGIDTVIALGKFILTSYIGVFIMLALVYPILLKLWGVKVFKFYNDIKAAVLTSFVTCSSLGTLPITLRAADKAGIGERVAKLTLPIGATVNMNGTAIRLGVGVVFAAEIMGIHLGTPELISIVVIGTLAAVGTAGVPGAGLIGMSIVFSQAGLPIEIVALTAGINVLVDMIFTLGNVTGDLVAAKMVDQSERKRARKSGMNESEIEIEMNPVVLKAD